MPDPSDAWVWLARVRGPQGRKGEVFANLLTDFPEKFAERSRLWLVPASGAKPEPREVELIAHWPHKGGMVLHFAGVESITAAELLKGLMVAIPQAERVAPAEDEAYIGDLVGCMVVDVAGPEPVEVGEVEEVDRSAGPVALLVVKGARGEVLIPYAQSFLRKIDFAGKRIEMSLPAGLVDLNAQ